MQRIGIVTDSAADLSEEQIRKYDIRVVPLTVQFGSESYADGVDISVDEFYEQLMTTQVMPRTSQPSPKQFLDVYEALLQTRDIILSIHISGRLSGTINSAKAASEMLGADVSIVDTKTASQGVARSVLIAAEAIRRGWSLKQAHRMLLESVNSTFSVFSVDTLEYLKRSGRIGRAASYLGSILRVKPILYADSDGMVAPYGKVLGRTKVIPKLIETALERMTPGTAVNLSVVHSGAVDAAHALFAELKDIYEIADHHIGMVGPAIGANIGPGALGLMIQPSFEVLAEKALSREECSIS